MCCTPQIKSCRGTRVLLLLACVHGDDTQMKTDIPHHFFLMSWQWALWVFDDGWVFVCKFKTICINLVSFQAFVLASITYGFIMLPYQMPTCTFIQYMQEEKLAKNFTLTSWLGSRSEVPFTWRWRIGLADFSGFSQDFMSLCYLFPRSIKFEESITKCNQIHLPSPKN